MRRLQVMSARQKPGAPADGTGRRPRGRLPPPATSGQPAAGPARSSQADPTPTGLGGAANRSGALSGSRGQVDVRSMVSRLNRQRSPAKRQRAVSAGTSSDTSADDGGRSTDPQLAPIQQLLQRALDKQTAELTERFESTVAGLREEITGLCQRVAELESHVNDQGNVIQQLHEAVDSRDSRIHFMEDELEELRREGNIPYLVFDGPGLPGPPPELEEEPWKEDVAATTRAVLQQHAPSVTVREEDIAQCYRTARGRKIVCRFARWGPGSIRDAIYDARTHLQRDGNGSRRQPQEQIYINEMLTTGAHNAFMKLRAARKRGEISSVHTRHGLLYARMIPHGQKICVRNRIQCERVLRGEY